MAKQQAKALNVEDKTCRLGKYSNNTEFHGDDWDGAWTFKLTGLMLTKDELNAFLADKHAHASWFDSVKGVHQPMPWWHSEIFYVSDSFEIEQLAIVVSGQRKLEFEGQEPDADEQDDVGRPAAVLSKITLKPQYGGMTELCGHLTLRPGFGKENIILQQHQHREVKVTMLDGAVREKSSKQDSLPLAPPAEDGAGEQTATH